MPGSAPGPTALKDPPKPPICGRPLVGSVPTTVVFQDRPSRRSAGGRPVGGRARVRCWVGREGHGDSSAAAASEAAASAIGVWLGKLVHREFLFFGLGDGILVRPLFLSQLAALQMRYYLLKYLLYLNR